MKSANEETLVDLVKSGLDRNPIDDIQLLDCFTEDNRLIAAVMIGHIIGQRKELAEQTRKTDEILKMVTDLAANTKHNTKISIINVSKLFVLYPDLLDHYDYDLELDAITYDGVALPPKSQHLMYLSIELERYFGSRDISHSDLLKAIKRYFMRIHKDSNNINEQIEFICQEYLNGSKTKPRTRIPQKHLRASTDLPLNEIKNIMAINGYVEWKDKNNCVHFYKIES